MYYSNIIFGGTYLDQNSNEITVEKLQPGDVIYTIEDKGNLVSLARLVNFSDINSQAVSFGAAGPSNAPYKSSSSVPFDVVPSTRFTSYASTYYLGMGLPMDVNGNVIKTAVPLSTASSTAPGNFGELYDGAADYLIKYLPFGVAAGKILVVEEIKCKSANSGDCEIRVREGSLEDIKCSEAYPSDGFLKCSKIFFYSQLGTPQNLLIMNLDINHDK